MITVAELEEQFKIKQNDANEIAIKMSIARQNIDPEMVSRQDFGRIVRCHTAILDIKEKAQEKIIQINQEAVVEHNKLVAKIHEALARYRPEAQITSVPGGAPVVEAAAAKFTPEDVGKAQEVLGIP